MKSEFLESELELYVQRLLIHEFYRTGNRHRMVKISPSEERLKGYDARIVGVTPFYCQFKTSDFVSSGDTYKDRAAFFKARGWPCTPFYKFALRIPNGAADKKNPKAWQHNILHQQWKRNPTGVAYVAPLFHTRTALDLMEPLSIFGGCPCCDCYDAYSAMFTKRIAVNGRDVCCLPTFDGLISVPPHVKVKDLRHTYAYTSHRDITFHSDPEMVEGALPFGEAIEVFVRSAMERRGQREYRTVTIDDVRAMLGNLGEGREFIASFLAFGLLQAGLSPDEVGQDAIEVFTRSESVLQQHVALAASLKAYFGITTLGLLEIEQD